MSAFAKKTEKPKTGQTVIKKGWTEETFEEGTKPDFTLTQKVKATGQAITIGWTQDLFTKAVEEVEREVEALNPAAPGDEKAKKSLANQVRGLIETCNQNPDQPLIPPETRIKVARIRKDYLAKVPSSASSSSSAPPAPATPQKKPPAASGKPDVKQGSLPSLDPKNIAELEKFLRSSAAGIEIVSAFARKAEDVGTSLSHGQDGGLLLRGLQLAFNHALDIAKESLDLVGVYQPDEARNKYLAALTKQYQECFKYVKFFRGKLDEMGCRIPLHLVEMQQAFLVAEDPPPDNFPPDNFSYLKGQPGNVSLMIIFSLWSPGTQERSTTSSPAFFPREDKAQPAKAVEELTKAAEETYKALSEIRKAGSYDGEELSRHLELIDSCQTKAAKLRKRLPPNSSLEVSCRRLVMKFIIMSFKASGVELLYTLKPKKSSSQASRRPDDPSGFVKPTRTGI